WRRALVTVAVGLPVMLVAVAFLLAIYVTSHILAALPYQTPADEFSAFGVAQQTELKKGNPAVDTPTRMPDGRVIDTLGIKLAATRGSIQRAHSLLIDARDHKGTAYHHIPNSIEIPYAGRPGNFHHDIQRKLEDELKKRTANNPDMPLIFYCAGSQCWES